MNVVLSRPWMNVQLYMSGLTNLTMMSNTPRCLRILGVMRRCVVSVFVLMLMRWLSHWFPRRGIAIRRLTTHCTTSFYTMSVYTRMHRLLTDSTMKSCLLM
ncbi:unnamed protein product [Prorocentrum cordatum]|uniref:Uncharacterized protein n=1 Tax=Prorocentrum cordatum TaxID=2364126 RepID=A0ABN9Q0W8_9DINO|nr:unnamed protein product [Polarella glacialis]